MPAQRNGWSFPNGVMDPRETPGTPLVATSDTLAYVWFIWLLKKPEFQNGTLLSGNMDQNLRTPSCLILSHTHLGVALLF